MATTMGSLDLNTLKNLRDDLTQYFWFESNSSATYGAGVHITLSPESSFIANPTGQNILMNTDGISIRNGLLPMMVLDNDSLDFNTIDTVNGTYTNVASFGASSTIGISDGTQSYLYEDYHSLQMIDKESNTYFYVSDLRDTTGYAEVSQTFEGDGSTTDFSLGGVYISSVVSITIDGVATTAYSITLLNTTIKFTTAPADGSSIYISILTNDTRAKAYTLGRRKASSNIGLMSASFGYLTEASGFVSFAEGYSTVASGNYSHAEGMQTEATGFYSHAEGLLSQANAPSSHAEGNQTNASGIDSHAEGYLTVAGSLNAHAEGYKTMATSESAHAEGYETKASGNYAHAGGYKTVADQQSQTAIGEYNTKNNTNNLFAIGNGTADNARSDAFTVDKSGNVNIPSGAKYKINGTALSASDVGALSSSGGTVSGNITATGTITASNAYVRGSSNPIGWYDSHSNTTSVSSGTSYTSISGSAITLGAGRYILFGSARFAGNATGYRGITIFKGSSSLGKSQASQQTLPSSAWTTALNCSCFEVVSSSTTYYLGVYQNSSSSLSVTWDFYAVQIG